MPKIIRKFQCDYCTKSYMRRPATVEHEVYCFHNPERVPREGDLAIWDTMPKGLTQINSYGVPGSEWVEPIEQPYPQEIIDKYKWWPMDDDGYLGLGYVWLNGRKSKDTNALLLLLASIPCDDGMIR